MKDPTYAAIDIGSNAVRLLIKRINSDSEKAKPRLVKLLMLRVPLRLGFDVFSKGELSKKKADDLVRFMKASRQLMKIYDVDKVRACATSAMRDACNGQDVIKEVCRETGIKVEIISGAEEASIVFNNHRERGSVDNGNYLYVDVGGGSTELNMISGGSLISSRSFNIGTVRILTGKVDAERWSEMNCFVDELHSDYKDVRIIGSGGNINKLYKLAQSKDTDKKSMSVEELERMYHILEPMSVEERMDAFSIRSDRADVIVPACRIFLNIARHIDAHSILVPTIGVADGIIDGMLDDYD